MRPNDLIGPLGNLPHPGAVVAPLATSDSTHDTSYNDIFTVGLSAAIVTLVILIMLGFLVDMFC